MMEHSLCMRLACDQGKWSRSRSPPSSPSSPPCSHPTAFPSPFPQNIASPPSLVPYTPHSPSPPPLSLPLLVPSPNTILSTSLLTPPAAGRPAHLPPLHTQTTIPSGDRDE